MWCAKRSAATIGVLVLTAVAVGACEIQRAQQASDAQTTMVGMEKEQVLACMGPPAGMAALGGTEVWTYNSGNGRTDTDAWASAWGGWRSAFGVGSSSSTSRFCKIDVVMNGGRVARVNYTGPTGGLLTDGEQCAFAIRNCLHQAAAYSSAPAPSQALSPQSYAPPVAAPATTENTPAGESSSPSPHAACTKEEQELVRVARENGYQYRSTCN